MEKIAATSLLICSTRAACEWGLASCRNLQTPSRVAALIHGALSSLSLMEGNWHDAIFTTGLFFHWDLLLSMFFKRSIGLDMVAHHVFGAALCLYSILTSSFSDTHMGSHLTRALILLETTNPLLHLLVILRNEKKEVFVPPMLLICLKAAFLLHFFFIRILNLGSVLWNMYFMIDKVADMEKSMFCLSFALWILQFLWLQKLVARVQS